MMEQIVKVICQAKDNLKKDDDFSDRMSHRYTVIILVTFAIVVTSQSYVGTPITCWTPAEFESSWRKYTNSYCWVRNTYSLPFEEYIPYEHETRHEIIYYQWWPFVFLLQSLNEHSGVDCDNILETASRYTHIRPSEFDTKQRTLTVLSNQIDRFVASPRTSSKGCNLSIRAMLANLLCRMCGKRFGNYLVLIYIMTKIMYLLNIGGQFYVLNKVLDTGFHLYGWTFINNVMEQKPLWEWSNSTVFPKVTMCDFKVRRLGNVQRYTLQCVLPINLYTERMYTFLWFWFFIVAMITLCSFLLWISRLLWQDDRLRYVKNHLLNCRVLRTASERTLAKEFVYHHLKHDGVFILRLVGHNTDGKTVQDIIEACWDNFLARQKHMPPRLDSNEPASDKASAPPEPPPSPPPVKPKVAPKPPNWKRNNDYNNVYPRKLT